METYEMTVRPFEMGTPEDAAIKVLEEAAEVFGAWQLYDAWSRVCLIDVGARNTTHALLADELADCIQACCNLAARHGIDLSAAMGRCEARNRERGRYSNG